MIPSFQVPTSVSLPNAMPIPNIPYRLPSFDVPRWTPIVPPLPEHQMMAPPSVAPQSEEATEEKPAPQKPEPQPPVFLPLPEIPKPAEVKPEPNVIPQQVVEEVVEEIVVIEIPFVGEIPVPSKEVLITAGSTAAVAASVSVVAALSATTIMDHLVKLFKPLLKFVMKRILKRKNKYTTTWARQRQSERLLHRRK